jgi:hypothetical protein
MKRQLTTTRVIVTVIALIVIHNCVYSIDSAFAYAIESPTGIRLTFPGDPRHNIAMSWNTQEITETKVRYGTSPDLDASSVLKAGETNSVEGTQIHHVILSELTANTTYYYQAGGTTSGWSQIATFLTAPNVNSSSLHFIAYGDNRSNRQLRRLVHRLILQNGTFYDPTPLRFIMHMGDFVASGDDQSLWEDYFEDSEMIYSDLPLLPTVGNHEIGDSGSKYLDQFSLPDNGNEGWYYAMRYGMAFILALDSEQHGLPGYDTQSVKWIETALAQSTMDGNVLWRFAFFHSPPFVSSSHLPREDIKSTWSPLFDQYGVDLVFNGHCHLYERSYPVSAEDDVINTGNPHYTDPAYPIYIVTGAAGMGGPIDHGVERINDYMVFQNYTWHFTDVSIQNDYISNTTTLSARVIGIIPKLNPDTSYNEYDLNQTVLLDEFSITKTIPDAWFHNPPDVAYDSIIEIGMWKSIGISFFLVAAVGVIIVNIYFYYKRYRLQTEMSQK